MNNLKLVSNTPDNNLIGVGKAELHGSLIKITAESETNVILLRGVNKVSLLKPYSIQQSTYGKVLVGDVYVLEKGDEKLTIKIEREDTRHEDNIYVNKDPIYDATSKKRKTTFTAGILILILLIVSVVFGVNQKNRKEFNKNSENSLSEAISDYEKSMNESGLDINSSRQLFVNAKNIAFKLRDDGYKNERLTNLIDNITDKESLVLGEKIVEVKEFLDLTLQTSGFDGQSIVSPGEEMFVLDLENKSIIQVDLSSKKAKIVAGKDKLEGVTQIASYEDKLFSLSDTEINEIDGAKLKVKEGEFNNSLFYLYSANIYLVGKSANQIFRFSGSILGKNLNFSDKAEWLAPGIEVDFSKIKDMTIDGSIWLLSSSGKVTKFTNGNPNAILMAGIVEVLTNPTAIYTNEDLKYVYILDSQKGRIIVLEKNGNFKLQYIASEIKEAKDLVVSEKEGKIILLTGSKLMYFEPK